MSEDLKKQFPLDKPLTSKEHLEYALNNLDESVHRFCIFKESFIQYCAAMGFTNGNTTG